MKKLSRQAFTMLTLTVLLQVWGKMQYLPILAPKFLWGIWHQNMQKGGKVQGGNNPWMDMLSAGEEIVLKMDVGCAGEVRREGGTHVEHTFKTEEYVYLCPLLAGGVQGGSGTGLGGWSYYMWRAGMYYSTSSQMWGSWYLPRFLFKGQSLTLMNIASLMVLVKPCVSLPTMEKLSNVVLCPVVWKWSKIGQGSWDVLCIFLQNFMLHLGWSHLYL